MFENMVNKSCRWLRRDDDAQNDGSFTYTEQSPVLDGVFTVQADMMITDGAGRTVGIDAVLVLFTEVSSDDRFVIDDYEYEVKQLIPNMDPINMVVASYLLYLSRRKDYDEEPIAIGQVTTRR